MQVHEAAVNVRPRRGALAGDAYELRYFYGASAETDSVVYVVLEPSSRTVLMVLGEGSISGERARTRTMSPTEWTLMRNEGTYSSGDAWWRRLA